MGDYADNRFHEFKGEEGKPLLIGRSWIISQKVIDVLKLLPREKFNFALEGEDGNYYDISQIFEKLFEYLDIITGKAGGKI